MPGFFCKFITVKQELIHSEYSISKIDSLFGNLQDTRAQDPYLHMIKA